MSNIEKWNSFRSDYVRTYGPATVQEISAAYQRTKSPSRSPRRRSQSPRRRSQSPRRRSQSPRRRSNSPHRLVGKTALPLRSMAGNLSPAKREKLYKLRKNLEEGRGSPTRGWSVMSPQRGRDRHALHSKCGDVAFLDPRNEKYPVMASPKFSNKCEYKCQGIESARNRACQYKNLSVANKAKNLGVQHCGWSRDTQPCNY